MKLQYLNNFLNDNYIDTGINSIFYDFEQGNTSGFFVKNLINSGAEQYGQSGGNKYILQDYYPGFFVSCDDKNYQNTGMAYFEGYDNLKISKNIISDTFSLMLNIKSYGCNPDYLDVNAQNLNEPSGIIFDQYLENNQITLFPNKPKLSNDYFGVESVMNKDANCLVASLISSSTQNTGFVYVFTGSGNTWNQAAQISGSQNTGFGYFGEKIEINEKGNIIAVGARGERVNNLTSAGAAYIFTGSGSNWTETARLTGNNIQANNRFGSSLAMNKNGNIIVVGSFENPSGSAYIFTGNASSWNLIKKISGSPLSFSALNVSINDSGNIIAISSPADFSSPTNIGRVYLYTGNNIYTDWNLAYTFSGSNPIGNYSAFGESVVIKDNINTIAISAPSLDIQPRTGAGAVYIFTGLNNNWNQTKILTGNNIIYNGANFGRSIDFDKSGNYLAVGMPQGESDIAGQVFICTGISGNWNIKNRVGSFDNQNGQNFGISLSISNDAEYLSVGSWLFDKNATNQGTVYMCKNPYTGFTNLNNQFVPRVNYNSGVKFQYGNNLSVVYNKSGYFSQYGDWGYANFGDNYSLITKGIKSKLPKTFGSYKINSSNNFLKGKAQTILNLKSETNATNPFDLKVAITNNFKPIIEFSGNYNGNIVHFNKICIGELGNQSIVSLNGSRNNISVCYHDFLSNRNFCETIDTTYNFLDQGKEIYIGNNFTGYNGSYYTGYRGLLDDVVLFTGLLDPSIELSLSKLFIKTGERIGTQTTIQTNYNLLSSGYLTTGYIGTGITGYELVQTQQIVNCTDNCLFYVKSGVTGLLTGEVIQYRLVQSESISYNETGINIPDYDSGNANVFAKNYLILYKPIDNKDYVEVQSYELFDNLRNTTYSFGGNTYTSETDFSGYKNMVFFNGVDIGSGYYRMQDIKKFIIDSYTKDSKDNVYYKRNISNAKEFKFEYSGQEYLSNAFSGSIDYNVFLNGQKLIENYNFTHYPYNSAFVTGDLSVPGITGYYYKSGESNLWIGPTYTNPSSFLIKSFLFKDSASGWRILSSAYGAPGFIGVPLYSGTASEYPWDSNFNTAYVGPASVPPYPDVIQNPLNSRIYINNDTTLATGEIYIIEDKYLVNITGSNTGFFDLKPNYGSDMIWLNGILQKEFDDYILLSCNNDSMQSYGQKEPKEGSIYNSESYRFNAI
jgi:hypothetical protein